MRFRRATATAGSSLLLAVALVAACRRPAPDGVALVGATLIDGSGGPPLSDAVVVVRRGHVESVGTRGGFVLPERTVELDVRGRWIIPGLIDVHAHVQPWSLPRYLRWGVTTVRDVHGQLDTILALRARLARGVVPGPRLYSAGAMIDGSPPTYPNALVAATPREARRAVDRLARVGADLVKVYTHVTPPLMAAVLDEARTFNIRVAGHLGLTDAVTAAKSGIGTIEHLTGVPEACVADPSALYAAHTRGFFAGWTAFERSWAGLDSATLRRVAGELAAARVAMVPTLVLHETFSRLDDSATRSDPSLAAVPPLQIERWDVDGMIRRAGWSAADYAAFRAARPRQDLFLREFAAAGGTIATGTDAANQLLVPGYSEHRELALLVAAGLSPRDALVAGTRNGALVLGVDSLGLLAPGKAADLVILMRDPLTDIGNSLSIDRVMKAGQLMSADSIAKAW